MRHFFLARGGKRLGAWHRGGSVKKDGFQTPRPAWREEGV